jgi:hypothetical protein
MAMINNHDELSTRVRAAMVKDPATTVMGDAAAALRELAASSHANVPGAPLAYHRLLHELHHRDDESTYWVRQWLASRVYDIEEQHVPPANDPGIGELTNAQFLAVLQADQRRLSPLNHPLFQYLFGGNPTFDEVKIYLEHKWLLILTFWRALEEFGHRLHRLERDRLDNVALVFKNVHEELGSGDASAALLLQHHRQLAHLGMSCGMRDVPRFAESFEYINFRMMVMRHEEPAWALGSIISQEGTSPEYTLGHCRLLERFGVTREFTDIYYIHQLDVEHTSEIGEMIASLVTNEAKRRICLASHRHQLAIWRRHFDRILEEIRRGRT